MEAPQTQETVITAMQVLNVLLGVLGAIMSISCAWLANKVILLDNRLSVEQAERRGQYSEINRRFVERAKERDEQTKQFNEQIRMLSKKMDTNSDMLRGEFDKLEKNIDTVHGRIDKVLTRGVLNSCKPTKDEP
jgi:TolA-binding protein